MHETHYKKFNFGQFRKQKRFKRFVHWRLKDTSS